MNVLIGPRRRLRGASFVLLTVALLVGAGTACAGSTAETSGGPAGPTGVGTPSVSPTSPAGSVPAPTVAAALRFSAPVVGGGQFDGASLAGKPAVLWFWAAWCPRCRAKAADIRAVQTEQQGKVTFVGVAGLGSGDGAMADFVAQHNLGGFTHLADDQGTVWRHFGVTEQEYFVVLDKTGAVVHKGPLSTSDLRQRLAGLAG